MITIIAQQNMIKVLITQKSILWGPSDADEQMSRQTDRPTDMAMLTVTVLSFVNKIDNSNVYEWQIAKIIIHKPKRKEATHKIYLKR
jgi:hypothetical protein